MKPGLKKRREGVAVVLAALCIFCTPALHAQSGSIGGVPTGPAFWAPMTFSVGPQTAGGRQRIFAVGKFVAGTAQAFQGFLAQHAAPPGTVIVFHSPGGAAAEGLALGRLIRNASFDTSVAQPNPNAPVGLLGRVAAESPGLCASACSLAFLGGVSRTVPAGSLYGVHDVSMENPAAGQDLLDIGQKIAGEIGAYLKEMGADSDLLMLLTRYNSHQNQILYMSSQQMAEMHVTTRATTTWSLATTNAGVMLMGRNTAPSNMPGIHENVVFACSGSPRRVAIGTLYAPEAETGDIGHSVHMAPAAFLPTVRGYAIELVRAAGVPVSQRISDLPIPPGAVVEQARATSAHLVSAFVALPPQAAELLRSTDWLTFEFKRFAGWGGVSVDFAVGRTQALQFIATCH